MFSNLLQNKITKLIDQECLYKVKEVEQTQSKDNLLSYAPNLFVLATFFIGSLSKRIDGGILGNRPTIMGIRWHPTMQSPHGTQLHGNHDAYKHESTHPKLKCAKANKLAQTTTNTSMKYGLHKNLERMRITNMWMHKYQE